MRRGTTLSKDSERMLRWILGAAFLLVASGSLLGAIVDLSFGLDLWRTVYFTLAWMVILPSLWLWLRAAVRPDIKRFGIACGLTLMAVVGGLFFRDSWLVLGFVCAQLVVSLLGQPRLYYVTALVGGLTYGAITYLHPELWPTWPVGQPQVYAVVRAFLYLVTSLLGGNVVSMVQGSAQRQLEAAHRDHQLLFEQFSYSLTRSLEGRDPYTAGHGERVYRYALAMSRHLSDWAADGDQFRLSAILHDVGKIGVPDAILHKPGRLTEDEYQRMKTHSALGGEIIGAVEGYGDAALWVRHHHERWDGRGYPDGLKEGQTPLPARVIAVADTLDTITTHRTYHQPLSPEAALAEIHRCTGSQFDPGVVAALEEAWPEILSELQRQANQSAV